MAFNDINCVMPWVKPKNEGYAETIKWQQDNSRYEIHSWILEDMEMDTLLPHCLEVRRKILAVSSIEAHQGPSQFRVFPRTLSTVLQSVWDVILDVGEYEEDQDGFDEALQTFIASNCTAEDRHELVQQLQHPRKPRDVNVQPFYYRLLELNSYVEWMPGTEASLTEEQLRQAFYDGMPNSWRDKFVNAGKVVSDLTIAEHTRYFRQQEKLSLRKQQENAQQQRRKNGERRTTTKNSQKISRNSTSAAKTSDSKVTFKPSPKRISADDPCPFHIGHKWGKCLDNAKNPDRDQILKELKEKREANANKKRKSNNGQSFAIEPQDNEMSTSSNDSSEGDEDSIGPVLNLNARIPRKGKRKNNKSKCFRKDFQGCNTTEIFSHHIDIITPSFAQNELLNSHSKQLDGYAECYMQYVRNCYRNGEDTVSISELKNNHAVKILHLKPIGLMLAKSIQGISNSRPLRVLFDSGSDNTFISRNVLPKGANSTTTTKTLKVQTINGQKGMNQQVVLNTLSFPEFSATQKVDREFKAYVFDRSSTYDIILGLDILVPLGIDISCSTQTIIWNNTRILWKPRNYFDDSLLQDPSAADSHCMFIDSSFDDDMDQLMNDSFFTTQIKESLYEMVSTQQILDQQKHLNSTQKQQLKTVLSRFSNLFNGELVKSGKLGKFKGPKVHLELLPNAQPVRQRPYPVPNSQKRVFKTELDRLCKIGVLEKTGPSEWLSPTFIIPKKDGRVRWVSDFRALNKVLKRKVYQLPKIQDILKKRSGYKYFTKIDISMQYYAFELDESSKNLCTICTPGFGNYRYTRCAMGVKQSPDIAQAAMENLFQGIDEVDVYIDDVGVFSNSWEDHIKSLSKVLTILQTANFTVNPLKCEWGVQETDWLGYWLTPYGLKPWKKKIDAILRLTPPTTMKQLRSFIGAVTFYRDMFRKRSHILAPLTKQVGQKSLKWTPECDKAFRMAKAMITKDAFLRYPDHNQPFHIYCDASEFQLGAAIIQNGYAVAFYSRKLSETQRKYTTGEKEMLSIVETLKEFRTMLYGCKELHIHTDHKNLLYTSFASQRVTRWRLFLEEYSPIFHYIKGKQNILADALSRLPCSERQSTDKTNPQDQYRTQQSTLIADPEDPLNNYFSMALDDNDLRDCFIHLPASSGLDFALDYESISQAQNRDAELIQLATNQPQHYVQKMLAPNILVYCYISGPEASWKIFLPNELIENAVRYYHLTLSHIGTTRLYDTMSIHFYNRALKGAIEQLVSTCDSCQRLKLVGRGHGQTAPREASLLPWREIAVDLIGPWQLTIGNETFSFFALTIIDLVTNLTEIVRLQNKTAAHVALQFENTWLSRYPRPIHMIYDQGGEFTGYHFQRMLDNHHIHKHPITTKNPQANAICERMHQVVGNSLRVLSTLNPPAGIASANQLMDTAIANTMFAMRATIHSALRATPGALAFGRDMLLDIPFIADLQQIQKQRQQLIDNRLIDANQKRFSYDYSVGEEVLKLIYKPDKLEPRAIGPYTIERVHANGTLTIRLNPHTIERISLRRVKPYRR